MKTVFLKLWIPSLVLLLTSVLILGQFFYQKHSDNQTLRLQKMLELKHSMLRLQRLAEEALNHNNVYFIEQEISELGLTTEISDLALINPAKQVQYANHYAWKNKPIATVIPEIDAAIFKQLSLHFQPILQTTPYSMTITGYFPVRFPALANNLRDFPFGLLYIRYDLSYPLAVINYAVITESSMLWLSCILLMFILMIVLSTIVTKPINHLITVMQTTAGDSIIKAQLSGNGELAILGKAFNQLMQRLFETQTHLSRQKNLYALLTATNQLIIRTPTQQQLFDEICQIVVRKPQLVLAWIGLINPQTQQLEVRAKAGIAEDYLAEIVPLLTTQILQGQGAIVTALHHNQPLIINEVTDNLELAQKNAIFAKAIFPIVKGQKAIGFLKIYANQAHYFTEDIVKLFDEMRQDISFALEKIETDELRTQAEETLRDREERLAVTLDAIGDAVITTDAKTLITNMNPVAEKITGWFIEQARGKKLADILTMVHPVTRLPVDNPIDEVLETGKVVGLAHYTTLISKHGKEFQIADSAAPIRDKHQQVIGTILVFQDVSEQYTTYSALKLSEERFRNVIEAAEAYIWEMDTHFCYRYLSEQVYSVKGYTAEELLNKQPFDFMDASEVVEAMAILQQALNEKQSFTLIHQNITPSGQILWEEVKGQVLLNQQGEVLKLHGVGISINQRKQAEAEISHLVYYDPLTCLPNRRFMSERLAEEFTATEQHGQLGALLIFDLDHFKNVNDSLGHLVGDELLIQAAYRLKKQVSEERGIAARLGGDEFMVLLPHLSCCLATAINRTRQITEKIMLSLCEPYLLNTHCYHCTSSVGIALFPQAEQNVVTLFKQADTALYRAKENGRNNFQFYQAEMQEIADNRFEMEKNLWQAIQQEQLCLYYQPQIDELGKMSGAEVLLRWFSPQQGFIYPDQFIRLAEEAGLILDMGYWVLQQSFIQVTHWLKQGLLVPTQHIAINLSSKQLKNADFVTKLQQIVTETRVNPQMIVLELTESVFLNQIDEVIEKMHQLKALGFRFSIDDFGTGYSSLAYLKRLPLDELKIDKSFIQDIDQHDDVIVETIIAMAQHLKLHVIAEGVETVAQLAFLKEKGCYAYQGYLFSKPLSSADFESYLQQAQSKPELTAVNYEI